jgi:hypothetical protein
MRYEMNSKDITYIGKRKWQTYGKTDGMGRRKILDDTMTNGYEMYGHVKGSEDLCCHRAK